MTETQSFFSSKYRKHCFHKDDDVHDNNMKAVTAEKFGKTQELIFKIFLADGQGDGGKPSSACFKNFAAC